jgi:multidrug efflux pump subunit AcrA (membrane-fusion protein)
VSRGKIIAAVVALVVVGLIAAGIALSAQSRVPQVSVAEVQKENLTQTVTASGQLEGDVKADVFPPAIQGALTLKSIQVSDGQQVKAGQLLATLDPEPFDQAVSAAFSGYKQAQSALVQAERSAPTSAQRAAADQAVTAAHASVNAAQASIDQLWDQRTLARRFFPSDSPTVTAIDAQIKAAQAQKASAQAQEASAKVSRDAIKSQSSAIAAAEAGVDAAAENLEIARQNRKHTALSAPIDGVVVFAGGGAAGSTAAGASLAAAGGAGKPTVGGQLSAASAPFTVYQLGALNFDAQVDEADISNVAVGMKATVTLDAFPGVEFNSTVVQVKTQAIQTSTGGTAFPVLLALKNTGKRLLVGMGGNADIQVSGIKDAVVVPVEALFDESGGTYVYVVDDKNVVHRRKVKTGITTDTQAQILEGVQPGEKVALGGLSNLKDGMTVRVK